MGKHQLRTHLRFKTESDMDLRGVSRDGMALRGANDVEDAARANCR
jgi:hypothetical protein